MINLNRLRKRIFDAISVVPARFGMLWVASEVVFGRLRKRVFDAISVVPARFGMLWMASEVHFWKASEARF